MLDDYKNAVIADYHQKKFKGQLSLNLAQPRPGQLREECLLTLNARPEVKDEKIIRDFFNFGAVSNDYSHCIKGFDPDRLKPLSNFLKGKTEDPDPKNIELLAWLIDFEPRPYKFGTDYGVNNTSLKEEKKEDLLSDEAKLIKDPPAKHRPSIHASTRKWPVRISSRKAIPMAAVFLLLTAGTCVYVYWESTRVYICGSRAADRYHLNENCPMLKNCKNGKTDMISVTEAAAKESGKTLCKFEH